MMKKDILIIGGGPAGKIAALTARANYPDKSILIVRKDKKTLTPCGIPYIFHTLNSVDKDISPDNKLVENNIQIIIDSVEEIDFENKKAFSNSNNEIIYDKLIIATGSTPYYPQWLKGASLSNVFLIKKEYEYLTDMKNKLENLKNIAVVGAGFIGVEIAEELSKNGKNVYLIEKENNILPNAFDKDFVIDVETHLKNENINLITGSGISKISGKERVEKVILEDNNEIDADAVVLAMGYKPNVECVENSAVLIAKNNNIWVDEYMRTCINDVFAVGDCAERIHFITRKPVNTMLASTATSEARVASSNLYGISTIKSFHGTISIFSTKVGNTIIGSAGLTEYEAKNEGLDVVTGIFEGIDRHPGNIPGAGKQKVKLIGAKSSGIIVGGQISGGDSSAELINILGYIIQNKMRAEEVFVSQIGTHPLTTAAPTNYPIVKASEVILKKS
ncbi:MAG: FAD-dependent oxidoreductase [Candidatus Muiribacteriota bacterium]